MKLTVIKGGRDNPEFVQAENQIKKLIRQGATLKIAGSVLVALSKFGLRLTQIKTMLSRCRVRGFEPNAESLPVVILVFGSVLEELEDQRIIREFALKVVVEAPKKPGTVAVIDIGQLTER